MRWMLLLAGVCVACGGTDPGVGHADLDSVGSDSPVTDPITAQNRKETSCAVERAWNSGEIDVAASPNVFNTLQPLFTGREDLIQLRDKVSPGCDWSLEVVGSTAPVEQWVSMHHGSDSFWSTNSQDTVSLDLIDLGHRLIHIELSHVSTRAEHDGDCGKLERVHIQALMGPENDDKRVLSPDGTQARIGDLIQSDDDRRIELWFGARSNDE